MNTPSDDTPATEDQKKLLRSHGVRFPKNLTARAASALLRSSKEKEKQAQLQKAAGEQKRAEQEDEETRIEEEWHFRINGWQDCFRKDIVCGTSERLYEDYAHRFKVPTRAQIKQILEALDAKHPGWEGRNDEAFFATLEASFPDTLKKSGHTRSKRNGFLVLVFFIVVGIVIILILLHWGVDGRHADMFLP